jgi:hypothetical protein
VNDVVTMCAQELLGAGCDSAFAVGLFDAFKALYALEVGEGRVVGEQGRGSAGSR